MNKGTAFISILSKSTIERDIHHGALNFCVGVDISKIMRGYRSHAFFICVGISKITCG